MENKVDWSVFESKYFKLQEGEKREIALTNWHIEYKEFTPNEPKAVLTFDILSLGGSPDKINKVFSTGNLSLIHSLKPIIERAEKENKEYISILLERKERNQYSVIDLENVRDILKKLDREKKSRSHNDRAE